MQPSVQEEKYTILKHIFMIIPCSFLVYRCRTVKKSDMILNNYLPKLTGKYVNEEVFVLHTCMLTKIMAKMST